jgi:hypothetical protein
MRGMVTPDGTELERQTTRALGAERARPLLRRNLGEVGHVTRGTLDDDPLQSDLMLHT